jgi:hypothetical protein
MKRLVPSVRFTLNRLASAVQVTVMPRIQSRLFRQRSRPLWSPLRSSTTWARSFGSVMPLEDELESKTESDLKLPDASELQKLRVDVAELRKEADFVGKLRDFEDEKFLPLHQQWNLFKLFGGIAVVLLGSFGYKEWKDVRAAIDKQVNDRLDAVVSFSQDFSVGLMTSTDGPGQAPDIAVPTLERAMNTNPDPARINNEVILNALLHAFDLDGRYDEGIEFIDRSKREHPQYWTSMERPQTFNSLGVVLLGAGLDRPEQLDSAERALVKGLESWHAFHYARGGLADPQTLGFLHMNLWMTRLVKCKSLGDGKDPKCVANTRDTLREVLTEMDKGKLCDDYWMPLLRDRRPDVATVAHAEIEVVAPGTCGPKAH